MPNTIALTKSVLKEIIRPNKGEKVIEYRCNKNPRHRVIAYHSRITFAVRLCWQGKRYYKTFGTYPEMQLQKFIQLADKFISDVQSGIFKRGSHLTVQEFFEHHLIPYSQKYHRSHNSFMSRSTKALALLGSENIAEVNRRKIEQCLDKLGVGLAPATINRYKAFYSKLFSYAVDLEIIDTNPCRGIKKLPESNIRDRVLTQNEISSFWDIALTDSSTFHSHALLFSLFTGIRIGNVITIKYCMIADDLSFIKLPMTKSGKPQLIFLNDHAKSIITKCQSLSENGFLFPSTVKSTAHIASPRSCMDRIKSAMQKCGSLTADFTIHDLRRTFASYQLRATSDIRLVQQSLGHSSVTVTERYAHHQPEHLKSASLQTADAMLSLSILES